MKKLASAAAELLRTLTGRVRRHAFTAALVVAGGSGTRFSPDGSVTKQMAELRGLPVVVRTLQAFEACPDIDEIVIAARADEAEQYPALCRAHGITKLRAVTAGGATRQESVLAAFRRISDRARFVAVHDAARCCVTPEMISAVCAQAARYGAAAAGRRATDTVKREDGEGFIAETLDRDRVWLVSTPQVVATEIYRACAFVARRDGLSVTDDCGLLEAQGFRVRLCDVGPDNIKITEPGDLALAAEILRRREVAACASDTDTTSTGSSPAAR